MNASHKPMGYNAVSPYFVIAGAQRFLDFVTELFDASPLRRYERPDGTLMHAEIRIDDSVLMVGDASDSHAPNTHLLHVYVPDVDTTFEKAMALGCTAIERPRERDDDPDRRGGFRDFAGNDWWVATQSRQG
jgi:PhnB protein